MPITRIGAEPGALTSGWSDAPATAQSVQVSMDQASQSPKTGDAARNSPCFASTSFVVYRCLSSAQLMA
ncbi:hypothetical protein, partial [Streptomyces ossamyceticus]|uniref:hypothetical protein n=1 Tax=Streptomyces ossamyceticus TaxID=249581 RepID=UPI0030B85675